MSVTIFTKDVGDVKDVFRRECDVVCGLEDFNEDYIKNDLGLIYG